ncbi:1466_t:CDS:2, partial [Racocetra persica]
LTIDPDFLDDLEIFFLADVARDSNLNPYKLFKEVIVKKLEKNVLATIHDEKSVFYRIINPEEIQHEKTLGGGMEKFAYHVEVNKSAEAERGKKSANYNRTSKPFLTNDNEKINLQKETKEFLKKFGLKKLSEVKEERQILEQDLNTLQNSTDIAIVEGLNKEITTLKKQNEALTLLAEKRKQDLTQEQQALINLAKQKLANKKAAKELLTQLEEK